MTNEKLTLSELERLAILSEEMGEVQQIIGKIIRHGYDSKNPNDINSYTNRKLLEKEIGDVLYSVDLIIQNNDVSERRITIQKALKEKSIKKYLHHQP